MSADDIKEAAKKLYDLAVSKKVKFPKIWDAARCTQTCGATLLVHRVSEGFDIDEAFKDLEEKYGLEEETKKSSRPSKKSKIEEVDIEAEDAQPKKAKKTEVVANEENRGIADAILEMATIYFKNKDARKGGVFSKAAKAIRECDTAIGSKKEAMGLKGVGKGIAGYIEEFLNSGKIEKLEELRAGTA